MKETRVSDNERRRVKYKAGRQNMDGRGQWEGRVKVEGNVWNLGM